MPSVESHLNVDALFIIIVFLKPNYSPERSQRQAMLANAIYLPNSRPAAFCPVTTSMEKISDTTGAASGEINRSLKWGGGEGMRSADYGSVC